MKLSPRRFPDTILRRREVPGMYVVGEWVPGAVVETGFRASVQPLKVEDVDFEGGAQFSRKLKVYIAQPDALAAAFEDSTADVVVYGGIEYVVTESQSWPGSHTKAVLLREP